MTKAKALKIQEILRNRLNDWWSVGVVVEEIRKGKPDDYSVDIELRLKYGGAEDGPWGRVTVNMFENIKHIQVILNGVTTVGIDVKTISTDEILRAIAEGLMGLKEITSRQLDMACQLKAE